MAELTSINVSRARNWEERIQEEMDAVQQLINQVNETLSVDPGEADPICKSINSVGEVYKDLGTQLINGFGHVAGALSSVLGIYETAIGAAVDLLDGVSKAANLK